MTEFVTVFKLKGQLDLTIAHYEQLVFEARNIFENGV